MSKGIDQVRKSISKRRRERQNTIEHKIMDKPFPSLPEEEEKHGYLPSYFGETKSKTRSNQLFTSQINIILLKAIAAVVLFIGAHFVLNSTKSAFEKPKELATNALTEDFPFARVYLWYQDTFGTPLAFTSTNTESHQDVNAPENGIALPVNGTLTEPFDHNGKGVFITPEETSTVTAWRDGFIIFAGNDRKTNKTIVIQHEDMSKTTYGNLSSIDVHLYQFVPRNHLIGTTTPTESEETFYFSLQKNNEYIDPFQVIQVDDLP